MFCTAMPRRAHELLSQTFPRISFGILKCSTVDARRNCPADASYALRNPHVVTSRPETVRQTIVARALTKRLDRLYFT